MEPPAQSQGYLNLSKFMNSTVEAHEDWDVDKKWEKGIKWVALVPLPNLARLARKIERLP